MKNQKLKKKLAGGHKFYHKFLLYIVLFFSKTLFSAQIYDYQTERFINNINSYIVSVNSYDKNIDFKIIKDDFPNAFVTEDNTIYFSSGLLVYSPDYVSLLGVLAHEIGHLEKYHVSKRKKEITNLKNISSYGNLATILGSMIIQEPSLINAIIVNQTTINNLYINFSQEQEIEADFYAVDTINKLNLPTNSIKEFLLLLENKSKFNVIDDELKKFSTHPIFAKRYEILEYKKIEKTNNFSQNLENEFNFIKAKFMAYTDNGFVKKLENDYKVYYDAIKYSQSGNLIESLKKINLLISKYNNEIFLLETKADILLSYGYNKEAIEFYKKVLLDQPQNNYVKYNIFTNIDYISKDYKFNAKTFLKNQNLIYLFPNNQILITKFYNLSKLLDYKEWVLFFEILLFDKNNSKENLNQLEQKTKDYNLKKLIKLYT